MVSTSSMHFGAITRASAQINSAGNTNREKKSTNRTYFRLFPWQHSPRKSANDPRVWDKEAEEAKNNEIAWHIVVRRLCAAGSSEKSEETAQNLPYGWTRVKTLCQNYEIAGLRTVVYEYGCNAVVVYYDERQNSDMPETPGVFSDRILAAMEACDKIKKSVHNKRITFTGYLMGGTMAQIAAFHNGGTMAVTFSAIGVAHLFRNFEKNLQPKNIINYQISNAETSAPSRIRQIGQIRVIIDNSLRDSTFKKPDAGYLDGLQEYERLYKYSGALALGA